MKRSILFIILTLLVCLPLSAQRQALKNIPYIDQRRMHYGFILGIDVSDISFEHNGKHNLWAECPSINPAFCVGLMGDLAFTENLNLRCTPMLRFLSRDVKFYEPDNTEMTVQTLKSNYISLPISLKIATHRLNNYRPYLLMGGQIDFDLAHEQEQPIVFKRIDMGLHIAIGCDTYLPFFKFCPELRFNLGMLDMIDHERKGLKNHNMMPYTESISSARNKSISLLFYFE